jgi:hypothetical protein
MRTLAIMASLAVLAACAQGPKQVQSTAPTVTYSYNGETELTDARSKAVEYCRGYGKSARLLSTAASGGTSTATFDCV